MCDPISLIAAAGTVVSAGIGYAGSEATLQAQQKANDDWVAYQQQASANARAQDEAARQKADAARQQTLSQVTPQAQQQEQQQASQTLMTQMGQAGVGTPVDPNTQALGSPDVGNPQATKDMAATVTQATRDAQGRIQALANLQGYGGAFGSAASTVNQALNTGNQAIGLQSDIRQGIARSLGVEQQVQPVHYVQGQNIAGSLAGALGSIAGSKAGTAIKGSLGL